METDIELSSQVFDKSDWQKITFGEVCRNVTEAVTNPLAAGYERYIGLEHIEPENLHITSWGNVADGTTFSRVFKKGQVLFGKRRAYQKKAAIANFDGVCSGDILVFEAIEEYILPELLPFLVNSDKFFEHAVQTSAGSLSPRTKFKDLADFEFYLPPKDQQARIAELLWAADELVRKLEILVTKVEELKNIKTEKIFNPIYELANSGELDFISSKWKCMTLQELIDKGFILSHLDGNHGEFYPKSEEFVEEGVPYLSANCISNGEIDLSKAKFLTAERALNFKKGVAKKGDILLAHNATVGPVCRLNIEGDRFILSTTLTYYRVNPEMIDPDYLYHFMCSKVFQSQLERVMTQSTRNQVPITTQRKLYFLLPPFGEQKRIKSLLNKINESLKTTTWHLTKSQGISRSLVNLIL